MKSKKNIQSDETKHKKSKAGESMSPTIGSFEQIAAKFQENPIEFKKTATPSKTASKNFSVLKKFDKKIGHGAVICFVEKDVPLSRDVTAAPVGYI